MSVLSNVTPRYVGLKQKGRVLLLRLTVSSHLASLLFRWKTANTAFVVLSFNFQVCRYSPTVAMSLLSTPSTVFQSLSACMIARSLVYAHFLETVVSLLVCRLGMVGELAYLYNPTSYTGGSSLPAGSPIPDRSKGRGQTKLRPQMVFLAAGERLLQW